MSDRAHKFDVEMLVLILLYGFTSFAIGIAFGVFIAR